MREALAGRKSGHGVKQTVAFFSLFHLHQLYTFVNTRKTSSYGTQFYKKNKFSFKKLARNSINTQFSLNPLLFAEIQCRFSDHLKHHTRHNGTSLSC